MHLGDWRESFLRTRVARRILLLFLVCALLPVTVLAVLGHQFVSARLGEAARAELRADSKTVGLIILDRLGALAAQLEQLAASGPPTAAAPRATDGPLTARFSAVVWEDSAGGRQALFGPAGPLPTPTPALLRQLHEHGLGLVVEAGGPAPRVFLVRVAGPAGARLWGQVDGGSIWGQDEERSPVPAGSRFCLATQAGLAIACSSAAALRLLRQEDDGTPRTWREDGEEFLSGRWTLFLGRPYGAESWHVVLGRPVGEVYAPLQALRVRFAAGLLFLLVVVFTLSHVQLRRTMEPLEALQAGTVRVARGDFTTPVRLTGQDEFTLLADSFNHMAADIARQFATERALRDVGRAALLAQGAEPVLGALLPRGPDLLAGADLAVALARPDQPEQWRVILATEHALGTAPREVAPSREVLARLTGGRDGFLLDEASGGRELAEVLGPTEGPVVVQPLLHKEQLVGALFVLGRRGTEGAALQAEARRYAEPLGVALVNTVLVEQLETLSWGALTALARAIDAVSPWTAGHSERVTLTALAIATELRLGEAELDLLHRGGLLHDVGKVGIPAALLDKPGALTPEEYAVIKRHPTIGARILAPIAAFRDAIPLVRLHHELLDGTGYPDGLAGEEIPALVRVLTVADVFDALTSHRPYREAWPVERALGLLEGQAGRQFEPAAVAALGRVVRAGWRPDATGVVLERASQRFTLWPEAVAAVGAQSTPGSAPQAG